MPESSTSTFDIEPSQNTVVIDNPKQISKNQLKKEKKKQWRLEHRAEKHKQERERRKEKRKELQAAGLPVPKRARWKDKEHIKFSSLNILIDLDFVELMNDNDLRMVLNQVKFCYAENRKQENPCHFSLCSFFGKVKEVFTSLQPGYANWKNIDINEQTYLDLGDKKNFIYLTSDSENVLMDIDPNITYIIGGLVDHNQHKNICYSRALENGISHARLPIDEFVALNSRKVLTINHVFQILLSYQETKDWKDAFYKVIPKRKVVSDADADAEVVNDAE